MEHTVRIFNNEGITRFSELLARMAAGEQHVRVTEELLFDDRFSEVSDAFAVAEKLPGTKYESAVYLSEQLELQINRDLYYNIGMWTWLSAFYLDYVCPLRSEGTRKPGGNPRHILSDPRNWQRYYRHLLACPCRLYTELGEASRPLLHGTLEKHGDMIEQIAAYQEIGTNPGIIDAVNLLYWDQTNSKLKRGAASKSAGSVRRFVHVIRQYQLTYDLNSMTGGKIAELLPDEFGKWNSL